MTAWQWLGVLIVACIIALTVVAPPLLADREAGWPRTLVLVSLSTATFTAALIVAVVAAGLLTGGIP